MADSVMDYCYLLKSLLMINSMERHGDYVSLSEQIAGKSSVSFGD